MSADQRKTAAMKAADAGLFVFFVKAADKEPLEGGGFYTATNDPLKVGEAFDRLRRRAELNAAIWPGASGVCIPDEDTPEGAAAWREAVGVDGLRTLAVRTGREGGGTHRYYRAPEGVYLGNATTALNGITGLDVRAGNSYAVLPPAIHGKTGQEYRFVSPDGELLDWQYVFAHFDELVKPLPAAGVEFIQRHVGTSAPEPRERKDDASAFPDPPKIPEGRRHDVLRGIAGDLIWMGANRDVMEKTLLAFAEHQCDPAYTTAADRKDIERLVTSTYRWTAPGDPTQRVFPNAVPTGQTLRQLDVFTMLTTPPPPVQWVAEGIAAKGVVTLLHGKGGLGKSMLALALAVAVVQGASFMGVPTAKGKVLYVDAENGEEEAHRRLHGLGLSPTLAGSLDYFIADKHDLRRDEGELIELAESGDYTAIVADSLASLWQIDENDAGEATAAMQVLHRLADKSRAAVVALHHDKKNGSDYRGSSAMQAVAQIVLHMTKDAERAATARCLTTGKCRLAPEAPDRWLEIQTTDTGISVVRIDKPPTKTEVELEEQIIELLSDGQPRTNRQLAVDLGRGESDGTTSRAVKAMTERGTLSRTKKGVTLSDPAIQSPSGGSVDQERAA